MNRNNKWKWALVAFFVAWSLWELYPPTDRDLLETFKAEAVTTTGNFSNIVQKAEALRAEDQKAGFPDRTYANLKAAVGTNELKQYFTTYDVSKATDPNLYILNQIQKKASGKIKLGLDLRGGSSFLMGMDTATLSTNVDQTHALSQAVEVLRRRVDKLGVAEPVIQPSGNDRIVVQMPGVSEAERESIKSTLTKAAYLELRMVHPKSEELLAQGIVEPGYEKMVEVMKRKEATAPKVYLVKKKAEQGFTGKYISQAFPSRDPMNNRPEILFKLNSQGADLFGKITTENVGRQMGIVLDGALISAPNIQEPIMTGSARITGDFTAEEAFELANALENPLQAPVKIIAESSVEPSLGAAAIKSGMVASAIAAVCTFVFMIVFYFFSGMIANIALALNVLILMGVMASLGSTLTLPGIAGIALTIGMAVDANVLIFERIREELAAGKSIRGAIQGGYDKAFGTIFDSNLTTLISSVILIYFGSGPVQGFGVTLSIGICASMFTAIVVTRAIYELLLERGSLTSIRMLPVIKATKIPFLSMRKVALVFSIIVILAGIGAGFTRGKGALGPDFAGGDAVRLSFTQRVDQDKLGDAVAKITGSKDPVQYQTDLGAGLETLQIMTGFEKGDQVAAGLQTAFPEAGFKTVSIERVGPTVGKEIRETAVLASVLALFGVLLYVSFRYELSFAFGAVAAVLHDVLFTLGIFILCGRELSAPMVAGVLTIIGYSINDKIVILDRIREDLKIGVRGTFQELIDVALNQTLSRTIITGGSVILATLSLLIFGGGVINDLAFTFLVGTLAGTYSSIYIASAIVLWWHRGERPKIGVAAPVTVENPNPAKA